MNTEHRALETLDLALKNAFETLNKFSIWVKTPDDSVTFNLVDAVPTLESNGTGVFTKPITVPSFASIRSSIFGIAGTPSERPFYWNINFLATKGWTFDGNSETDSPELKILVDTFFGASDRNTVGTYTNRTENYVASKISLDADSSIVLGDILELSNLKFNSKVANFILGKNGAAGSIFGNSLNIGGADGTGGTSALRYVRTVTGSTEVNTVTLGPTQHTKQRTFNTTVRGGNVYVEYLSGKNLRLMLNDANTNVKSDILAAMYEASGTYAVSLAKGIKNISSLTVGDVKKFLLTASDSIKLTGDHGSIQVDDNGFIINGLGTMKVTSDEEMAIGSKTSVSIGIEDDSGDVSKEIVVKKGSVSIPNLYVSKKANYQLSGVKHRSIDNPALCLEYIPFQKSMTKIPVGYSNAMEYTVAIASELTADLSSISSYSTTINDFNGERRSFVVYSKDSKVKFYSAPVDDNDNLTGEYDHSGDLLGISVSSDAVGVPMVYSSANYMYVIVTYSSKIEVYYSSDSLNFVKLGVDVPSLYAGNEDEYGASQFSYDSAVDFSLEVNSDGALNDYIWIAVTFAYDGVFSASDIISINNNCGIPTISRLTYERSRDNTYLIKPLTAYDSTYTRTSQFASATGDRYVQTGGAVRIKCGSDTNGQYAMIASAGFAPWTHSGVICGSASILSVVRIVDGVLVIERSETTKPYNATGANSDPSNTSPAGKLIAFTYNPNEASTSKFVAYTNSTNDPKNTCIQSRSKFVKTAVRTASSVSSSGKQSINVLASATKFYVESGDVYPTVESGSVSNGYIRVLSTNAFAKTTKLTVKYMYNGNEHSIVLRQSVPSIKKGYSIFGAYIDYFNIGGYVSAASDCRMVFTNLATGVNEYVISSEGDSPDYAETSEITDDQDNVVGIVDIGNSLFLDRLNVVSKSSSSSPIEVFVSACNSRYEVKTGALTRVQSNSAGDPIGAMRTIIGNVHLEPISYVVKNRLLGVESRYLAGYNFEKTTLPLESYRLSFDNNGRSGYRIPFYSKLKTAQVIQSSYNTSRSTVAADFDFAYDPNVKIIVFPCDPFTYVLFVNDESIISADGSYITVNGEHAMIKFENKYLDPQDVAFDSSLSVTNEFGNVVSIRCDNASGYRAGMLKTASASITYGLTEIAQSGGDC